MLLATSHTGLHFDAPHLQEEPVKKGPFDDLEYPKALKEKVLELRETVDKLVKERNQIQADRVSCELRLVCHNHVCRCSADLRPTLPSDD
jgi:hypothetical protein